ncbi:hypothetical protein BPODLACK_03988 [Gordonia sp. YY1]|nr:hypothetical protein BPODLACK_03988 [Gordonia sp. YY1]
MALLALLPGALYELAREQRSGRWGLRGTDQLFRMLSFSVAFQVLISPLTYWLYSHYVVSGLLIRGEPVSGWLWVLLAAYLLVPFALGRFTAMGHRFRETSDPSFLKKVAVWIVNLYTDAAPAPRAWDYLFSNRERRGWIVLHLHDGTRIGAMWGNSYAAGYREDSDLFLSEQVELASDGTFILGPDQLPKSLEKGLLIRWDEIKYLDFYDA